MSAASQLINIRNKLLKEKNIDLVKINIDTKEIAEILTEEATLTKTSPSKI